MHIALVAGVPSASSSAPPLCASEASDAYAAELCGGGKGEEAVVCV